MKKLKRVQKHVEESHASIEKAVELMREVPLVSGELATLCAFCDAALVVLGELSCVMHMLNRKKESNR